MSGQDCATVIDQGSVTLRSPVAAFRTWPEEFRRRYRELGYWTDETFAEFVADRVVVALPNVADFVAVVLGLFRLGALPIFALPTHRELELTQFCVTADAAAMVVATDDLAGLHAVVAECVHDQGVEPPLLIDVRGWGDSLRRGPGASRGGPAGRAEDVASRGGPAGRAVEDVAFLQLSGGTTGTAKLIPRTAADYLYSVRESAAICGLTEDSALLVVLPAAHNFPMSSPGILGVLHVGGRVVLARTPARARRSR